MRPRIYLAHPYGRRDGLSMEQLDERAERSHAIHRLLILKGWNVYEPNLMHHVHKGWRNSPNEETYFYIVSDWIRDCDAFFYGGKSNGCDRELEIAKSLGMPIYYDLEDIPDAKS